MHEFASSFVFSSSFNQRKSFFKMSFILRNLNYNITDWNRRIKVILQIEIYLKELATKTCRKICLVDARTKRLDFKCSLSPIFCKHVKSDVVFLKKNERLKKDVHHNLQLEKFRCKSWFLHWRLFFYFKNTDEKIDYLNQIFRLAQLHSNVNFVFIIRFKKIW